MIAQNDNMVAINSALEVDLTGQVCADSLGTKPYSGFGGQVDFMRGAARSKGGKPIIALPSTAKNGARIAHRPVLSRGPAWSPAAPMCTTWSRNTAWRICTARRAAARGSADRHRRSQFQAELEEFAVRAHYLARKTAWRLV